MRQTQALAILKSGRSFDEAAAITGLTIAGVMEVWRRSQAK